MKRLLSLAVIAAALFLPLNAAAAAAGGKTLLVFDSSCPSADIQSVELPILAYGGISSVAEDRYTGGLMSGYSKVIVLSRGNDNASVMSDLASYTGTVCWIGPGLGRSPLKTAAGYTGGTAMDGIDTGTGAFAFTPGNTDNFSPAGGNVSGFFTLGGKKCAPLAFGTNRLYYFGVSGGISADYRISTAFHSLLSAFFNSTGKSANFYLAIDYVYPVSDLNLLCTMAQDLKAAGLPFVFTVMPFYSGTGTEAYDAYGKALRYLEQCGGTPVIHAPIFNPEYASQQPDTVGIQNRMLASFKNYAGMGIYPLGLEMPENSTCRTAYSSLISGFSDYFEVSGDGKDVFTLSRNADDAAPAGGLTAYPQVKNIYEEIRAPQNSPDNDFLQKLEFYTRNATGTRKISIPSWTSLPRFKQLVDEISTHKIAIADFSSETQTVTIGDIKITGNNGAVVYNDKPARYVPPAAKAANKKAEKPFTLTGFLSQGNAAVVLFSSVSLVLLALSFIVARHMDRQKFLHRR